MHNNYCTRLIKKGEDPKICMDALNCRYVIYYSSGSVVFKSHENYATAIPGNKLNLNETLVALL